MNISETRFPRQLEAHAPRLLGCLLDIDGALRALVPGHDGMPR